MKKLRLIAYSVGLVSWSASAFGARGHASWEADMGQAAATLQNDGILRLGVDPKSAQIQEADAVEKALIGMGAVSAQNGYAKFPPFPGGGGLFRSISLVVNYGGCPPRPSPRHVSTAECYIQLNVRLDALFGRRAYLSQEGVLFPRRPAAHPGDPAALIEALAPYRDASGKFSYERLLEQPATASILREMEAQRKSFYEEFALIKSGLENAGFIYDRNDDRAETWSAIHFFKYSGSDRIDVNIHAAEPLVTVDPEAENRTLVSVGMSGPSAASFRGWAADLRVLRLKTRGYEDFSDLSSDSNPRP